MIKKIFVTFLLFLTSCEYQPLYSNKNANKFVFQKIESIGDKNINRHVISSTFFKEDNQDFSYEKLILDNNKTIIEVSKNSKGQVDLYKMTINLKIRIIDKNNILKEKEFSKEFSYSNLGNKFDLSQYETDVEDNLVDKIVEELIIYLNL
jgi:hypothetical protein